MTTPNPVLQPLFDFTSTPTSILLHEGEAEIDIEGQTHKAPGQVRLELLPRPGIYIYEEFSNVGPPKLLGSTGTDLKLDGRPVDGFCVNFQRESSSKLVDVKWRPSEEPIQHFGDETSQMECVVFHLFNFVDLWGTRRTVVNGRGCAHVDLTDGSWDVEIASLPSTEANFNALKAEGGYQLTHVGCFKRTDGQNFTGKDAREFLDALRLFFSFAKGGGCDPICPVGLDDQGNRVWTLWSSPGESWRQPITWFDPHHCGQLTSLFPGFMDQWGNANWRRALSEVIYWYLNSNHNSRGIDAGIILTQAAIERLAYEYVVNDTKSRRPRAFKKLNASDKFREVFVPLGLPASIPPSCLELTALSLRFNWSDALHALTEIRNSLVHPEHKLRGNTTHDPIFEAWTLGLWYLGLAILRICDYSGTYANRLKVQRWLGDVESVPWSPS